MGSNNHDHAGYRIKDLYIKQRCATFKEEITEYPDFSTKDYAEVNQKLNIYLQSNIVKKSKAFVSNETMPRAVKLQYDIPSKQSISSEHILSILLYTDFSNLCTSFSKTFRALHSYEALSSIKARNSRYWWMSRRLREAVQVYGASNSYSPRLYGTWVLAGPFFCGLSYKMAFPEYHIRLCSPTRYPTTSLVAINVIDAFFLHIFSTSRHVAIACRFAGPKGLVVQMNNTVRYHGGIRAFDCSWLSTFKCEDEVLFCGGHYTVQIQSVQVMDTGKKYKAVFRSLGKFNAILNGDRLTASYSWTRMDAKIIKNFLNWRLGKSKIKRSEYTVKTLNLFASSKRHLFFSLPVYGPQVHRIITDVLFYAVSQVENYVVKSAEDTTNIIRKELFAVFKNVETITINASGFFIGKRASITKNALSFERLLLELTNQSFNKITITALRENCPEGDVGMKSGTSWILEKWKSSSERLVQIYKEQQLSICLEKPQRDSDGKAFDSIIITKIY